MKTIIFGATGTVGKLATERMLADGHRVTAFARTPDKLKIEHENLTLLAGNAASADEVSAAVEGHEAVVITLGAGLSRSSTIRSDGTRNVILGMQKHGVKRLVCQSTLGVHESWENLNFFWKRIMFGALLRPVFKDHELQEELVRVSGLNWTIVRPSAFAPELATGGYKENFPASEPRLSLKINPSDIAGFLSRQLSDMQYLRRAVGIST